MSCAACGEFGAPWREVGRPYCNTCWRELCEPGYVPPGTVHLVGNDLPAYPRDSGGAITDITEGSFEQACREPLEEGEP